MWLDELAETALRVIPALVLGGAAVRLIFGHPAFWVVGVALAGALLDAVWRPVVRSRSRE